MQYVPKGTPMHEKLSTTFVRVEALVDELQAQGFTGYVLLNFPQSNGYIYFTNGQILNAVEEGQQDRATGRNLTEQLIRQAAQARGHISIYNLHSEAVSTLAGIADGQLVYENLTSDFASVGKLIKKIARERKLHFITLSFADQPREGGLDYIDGDRIEVFCSTTQGELTGSQALQQIVTQSEGRLAAFSLYRARGSELPAFDDKDVETSLNRLAPKLTASLPPIPQPEPSAPVQSQIALAGAGTNTAAPASPPSTAAPSSTSNLEVAQIRPRPEINGAAHTTPQARTQPQNKPSADLEDVLDVIEASESEERLIDLSSGNMTVPKTANLRPAPTPASKISQAATSSTSIAPAASQVTLAEPKGGAEMSELTGLMSQVISAIERGMTVAGRGSSFPTALRAGLLAVTEQFPFLDPFAAEFEYQDREIVFVGSATPEEFARGLTEALRQMVEDLIYSSNGRVRDYILEELHRVEKERGDDLAQYGLENISKRICQN